MLDAKDLIARCWAQEPDHRPSASEAFDALIQVPEGEPVDGQEQQRIATILEHITPGLATDLITVQSLDLCGKELGDSEVYALAQVLKTGSAVNDINLSNNYIHDAGVLALSQGLQKNSSLKEDLLVNQS